jgi:2-methylisocitrate lyase-like PEP mutase family enzyme
MSRSPLLPGPHLNTVVSKTGRMRQLLAEGIVVSPGFFDGYSGRLIEKMGFKAASISGAALANSRFSVPDIGIMSLLENVQACGALTRGLSIPVMADADTGYGNPVTVHHLVECLEAAGIVGVSIEDQVSPKRCGHMAGKELINVREMGKKIEAAAKAKRDADFIINARTDAIAIEGIEKAIERARFYVASGADMVLPDGIRTEDQIKRFVEGVGAPVTINMGFGIRSRPTTQLLSIKRLGQLGVARVMLGRMLPGAALMGMHKALEVLLDSITTGKVPDRPDLIYGMEQIAALMGYERIAELESKYLCSESDLSANAAATNRTT